MKKKSLMRALPIPYPQTPQSAREYIRAHGLCVTHIGAGTGIDRCTFSDLLSGRSKGCWGNAHKAAVLLGLKQSPQNND